MTWKHGDIFIATIDAIPGDVLRRPAWVLVEGEATGHSHRLDRSGVAERLERGETLYLRVLAEGATVIDQRHRPITLPRGLYQVWKQRDYSPGVPRKDAKGDAEIFKKRRLTRRMREPLYSAVAVSIGR
jgi:hypothetical protein